MQSNRFQQYLDHYVGIPLCVLLSLFCRRVRVSHPPQKILFIQLSALGDTILAVPTIRAIRQAFPDAEITMLASRTNLTYLANCPYIDKRILFKMPGYRMLSPLRREGFDWVIDLEHWPRLSALLTYATGAPVRIGFRTKGQHRHFLFTETVPHIQGRHEVRNFLEIATRLACPVQTFDLEVWCDSSAEAWVRETLIQEQVPPNVPLVVLHPEAGRRGEPRRRWSPENYVALADALIKRFAVQIVLTGAPDEVNTSEAIAAQMQHRAVILAGRTDVNQLAALFSDAALVVSGNCGPMHLAAATGTPVIGLHGPTNPAQWGPWSRDVSILRAEMPCSPCLNLGFEYGCQPLPDGTSPCMWTIDPESVLRKCEQFLA